MRLPTPLLRLNPNVHKNDFGHVLILAGSARMLGAGALCGLAAMRSGAGLVTLGVPKSLVVALQKINSPVIMALPLKETRAHSISSFAFDQLKHSMNKYQAIAIGPGLSTESSTQQFILKIIEYAQAPIVIDADALSVIAKSLSLLIKSRAPKVLTPHPGEMAKLIPCSKTEVENNRETIAREFAQKYQCVLVLKGHRTIVASPDGEIYKNQTGNSGMATAGSGDVLTGMISAMLGQSVNPFTAAKSAVYLHGLAGDLAARKKTRAAMLATDIIDCIPKAIQQSSR
jgi:ADP-dependent NAD(P)H-hydrate dehydratase / NAD(P)H-hydrate epimerase